MTSNKPQVHSQSPAFWRHLINEIPEAYAGNIFSTSRRTGWFLLLLTLNDPYTGLAGLAGLILSLGFNRRAGYATSQDYGFSGINSLLTSLAVAYFYPFPGEHWVFFILILGISSIMASLTHQVLNRVLRYYFNLPAYSLPFVLVTALICFLYNRATGLPLTVHPHQLLITWYPDFPSAINVLL